MPALFTVSSSARLGSTVPATPVNSANAFASKELFMKRISILFLVVAASSSAFADTFLYQGQSLYGTAKIDLLNVQGPDIDGQTVKVGESLFKYGNEAQTYGYCVDLQADAGDGTATKSTTAGLPGGLTIGFLLNTYAPVYHAAGDKKGAMALQLAIWDILYETNDNQDLASNGFQFNMNSGHFRAQNFKVNNNSFDPSSYFTAFQSSLGGSAAATYYDMTGCGGQSFASPVPEPATLAVLGAGALGLLRRRKARQA